MGSLDSTTAHYARFQQWKHAAPNLNTTIVQISRATTEFIILEMLSMVLSLSSRPRKMGVVQPLNCRKQQLNHHQNKFINRCQFPGPDSLSSPDLGVTSAIRHSAQHSNAKNMDTIESTGAKVVPPGRWLATLSSCDHEPSEQPSAVPRARNGNFLGNPLT